MDEPHVNSGGNATEDSSRKCGPNGLCYELTYMNRNSFEQIVVGVRELLRPLQFDKKFRVMLEHDPENNAIEVKYYYPEVSELPDNAEDLESLSS